MNAVYRIFHVLQAGVHTSFQTHSLHVIHRVISLKALMVLSDTPQRFADVRQLNVYPQVIDFRQIWNISSPKYTYVFRSEDNIVRFFPCSASIRTAYKWNVESTWSGCRFNNTYLKHRLLCLYLCFTVLYSGKKGRDNLIDIRVDGRMPLRFIVK